MSFDAAYEGESIADSLETVPWSSGEPQPRIAALIGRGLGAPLVLGAGCEVGETVVDLAARGDDAVGPDSSVLVFDVAVPDDAAPSAVTSEELRVAVASFWGRGAHRAVGDPRERAPTLASRAAGGREGPADVPHPPPGHRPPEKVRRPVG